MKKAIIVAILLLALSASGCREFANGFKDGTNDANSSVSAENSDT